ncbi:MAG: hypothetical protein ABUS79_11160 [Pseudomonadota bacterium]
MIIAQDVENAGRALVSLSSAGARARLLRRSDQLATYLAESVPEVVLIDCLTAHTAALVRQLRRDPRTARAVIVGLAAGQSRGQRARLRAAGMNELLAKPVQTDSFARRLIETVAQLG